MLQLQTAPGADAARNDQTRQEMQKESSSGDRHLVGLGRAATEVSRGPAPSAARMAAPGERLCPFPPARCQTMVSYSREGNACARDTELQGGSRGRNGEGGTWLIPVLPPARGEERQSACSGSCVQVIEGPSLPQPAVCPEESTLQSENEGVCSSQRTCKQRVSQAAA